MKPPSFQIDRRRTEQAGCSKAGTMVRRISAPTMILPCGHLFRLVARVFSMCLLTVAVTTAVQAQTFSVLYNFGITTGDAANPANPGILAQGRDGNMYGTTVNGGTFGLGAVFQITPAGKLQVIYSFNEAQGYAPYSGLTLGTDGNFYGATANGAKGFGIVFRITSGGSLTVLYTFTGGSDGRYPMVPPIMGRDGNWYGTTQGDFSNDGTVYRLTPSGKLKTICKLVGSQGSAQSRSPLVLATDGNFYGTTADGGANNQGMVFRVTPTGVLTPIYNFGGSGGTVPLAPLIQGSDGYLYGTTSSGGSMGAGILFKLSLGGSYTLLYNAPGGTGLSAPYGGLVQATDGNFYGTTYQGGVKNDGDIFRLTAKKQVTGLFDFNDTDGYRPEVTLLQNTNGVLYGDTYQGGTSIPACGNSGCGVFFSWNEGLKPFVRLLPPTGSGKIGFTVDILGQGLTGTTSVSFDGVAAKFTVVTDNYLTAVVPTGAKTGSVTAVTPAGTLSSSTIFLLTPVIKSFSPTSGPVGTSVKIMGQSLTQTTKVTFNGVSAKFTVNSDSQVTATVPQGAKTGKIKITTPGGNATSSGTFTVT